MARVLVEDGRAASRAEKNATSFDGTPGWA